MTPSSSLNANEALAKGCCFHAVSKSDKFLTKSFQIKEVEKTDGNMEKTVPGIDHEKIAKFADIETQLVKDDIIEISRQEAKNILEEQLYKYRSEVNETSDGVENTDEFINLKEYFQQIEDWLYEEGEEASEGKYKEMLSTMHEKITTFHQWKTEQIKIKALEEKRKRLIDQETSEAEQDHKQRMYARKMYARKMPNHDQKQEHHHNEDDSQMNFSSPY